MDPDGKKSGTFRELCQKCLCNLVQIGFKGMIVPWGKYQPY